MKIETAKCITILDFEIGRVFQYKIKDWDIENESCEDFITRKGHRLKDCSWMVHEEPRVITICHKLYQ